MFQVYCNPSPVCITKGEWPFIFCRHTTPETGPTGGTGVWKRALPLLLVSDRVYVMMPLNIIFITCQWLSVWHEAIKNHFDHLWVTGCMTRGHKTSLIFQYLSVTEFMTNIIKSIIILARGVYFYLTNMQCFQNRNQTVHRHTINRRSWLFILLFMEPTG